MLLTKEHLLDVEKTVGYDSICGVEADPNGLVLHVMADHPLTGITFKVRKDIPYESDLDRFELWILYFGMLTKRLFDKEFSKEKVATPSLNYEERAGQS